MQITAIDPLTGKLVNIYKQSKNAKRKAERYGDANPKAERKPRKGVTGWQYATQITHRARFGCNPETKLILQGC